MAKRKDSWTLDGPFLTENDPISRLTELSPFKLSEDKKGHDASVHFRVPKNMTRMATKIKEKGPYETNSDVARDAYYLGLRLLYIRYNCDEVWKLYCQAVEVANDAAWEAALHEQEASFVSSLASLCRSGKDNKALQYLSSRLVSLSDDSKRVLIEEAKSHGLSHLLDEL